MSWKTILAIYIILWWIVLFAILPWGVRTQEPSEVIPGTDPGAPTAPALGTKVMWTTIVSAIVFALFYAAHASRVLTLDDLATLWGLLDWR